MVDRPTRRETDIIITLAAGETRREPRYGRTYQTLSIATDGVVQVGLGQPALQGKFLYKGVGDIVGPGDAPFEYIEFFNTSGAPVTLVLQTSFGDIRDSRLNLVGGTMPVNDMGADGTTDFADQVIAAGASYTVAANPLRKSILVYNNSATDTLKWGAAPDATHGFPIPPASMQGIPLTGAFKVFNAGVANVTINLQELTKA
jgi:hypothetical protein